MERTRSIYREALTPLMEHIGTGPLRELTARDVRARLKALSGGFSTRYLQIARASLARAIRYAEVHDLVGRNVAMLVDNPKGQVGGRVAFGAPRCDTKTAKSRRTLAALPQTAVHALREHRKRQAGGAAGVSSARSPRRQALARDGCPGPAPYLRVPGVC